MKRFIKSRKAFALLATFVVAGIVAAGAYTYFTASGSGSGLASVGSDNGVTIDHVAFTGGPNDDGTLYPDATVNVGFRVNNGSANTAVKVDKVIADTAYGASNGVTTSDPTHCLSSWFTYTPDAGSIGEISASDYLTGSGTLKMSDAADNQDACKLATITLHLTTDNSGI